MKPNMEYQVLERKLILVYNKEEKWRRFIKNIFWNGLERSTRKKRHEELKTPKRPNGPEYIELANNPAKSEP